MVEQLSKEIEFQTYPTALTCSVDYTQLDHATQWIFQQGQTPTLIVMLRLTEKCVELLAKTADETKRSAILLESARHQLRSLEEILKRIDGAQSIQAWDGFCEFPFMHSAVVRRPRFSLGKLLNDDEALRLISSVMPNHVLGIPLEDALQSSPKEIEGRRARLYEVLSSLSGIDENDYLDSLGVADFSGNWQRPLREERQRACVLDSGVDESHIALQGVVAVHDLFDSFGQEKGSKYSFDRGCHGTKTCGTIAARTMSRADLGLTQIQRSKPLRLGICQNARLSVMNISQGPQLGEATSLSSLLAAMNWAVKHKNNSDWGGYQVVNMSLELVSSQHSDQVSRYMDETLEVLLQNRLIPILASGNRNQSPLGTKGVYVGACDRDLQPLAGNGSRVDLLAPGNRLVCCQPPLTQLGSDGISCYSGSSLAAAWVTGVVLKTG